ncbi:MAG: DUF484 family protein [Pseudomonadota bacterium]
MTATLDFATVAQFLTDHPRFFDEHASLLGEVRLASPLTGRAVSLQERQMEVMRDKYRALEARMADLARLAEENQAIATKFHGWTQSLLQVRQPIDMPQALIDSLQASFGVPHVTLRLWQLSSLYQEEWFARDVSDDVRLFANSLLAPYCGSNHDFEAVRWLDAADVTSTVILPLRSDIGGTGGQGAFGLLVLGSPDPARFSAHMATDFLTHIGETASSALTPLKA